jgi:hypothetical protein
MVGTSPNGRRRILFVLALVVPCSASGCGKGLHPVRGKVVYEDGSPMTEGFVICEMKDGDTPVMARGEIQSDGTFQLGTLKPRDGAHPGKYRVLVMPNGRTEAEEHSLPPVLDRKFQSYNTSGLVLDVQEGSNEVTFRVAKPAKARR